jgi:hypothetical protein
MNITFRFDNFHGNAWTFDDEKESYIQLYPLLAYQEPNALSVEGLCLNSRQRLTWLHGEEFRLPNDPEKANSICRVILEKIKKKEIEVSNVQDIQEKTPET